MTQQPPPEPPQQPYPPPYRHPPYPPPKPRHPEAVTVLVLGCVATAGGFLTAGLATVAGPFAWVIGAKAKREIAAEPGRWDGEDLVNIGYVLGIVGTILLALAILSWVIGIVVIAGMLAAWL